MTGKRSCKPVLFSQDRLLELHDVGEFVLAEQHAAGIHFSAVFVAVTPDPGGTVILQCEPQRIDLCVASSTLGSLSMRLETFAERQILIIVAVVLR